MDKIDEVLTRGVEKIYPTSKAFEKVLRSGKKIKLYQGFDPSMANLHLGNLVGILKLKQFQNLGHEVIFLVGDFTGMIGDPTDRASSRKLLTRKQVLANSMTWKKQAGKIIKFSGKNPAIMLYNSQWGDKVTFKDLIEITSKFTVQQMLERDFFQRRLKAQKPIHLHEFLYPVAQAIDCVEMDVDLEIGGRDQTFNMLAGRTLMKALKGKEKFVLTTKLLVDAKGEKVGKTAGNALFLNASASDMYGGVMSLPDETIIPGFELLTMVPLKKSKAKPMNLKKQLAFEIVKMLYGEKDAKNAGKEFERIFQKRRLPSEIQTKKIVPGKEGKGWRLFELVSRSGLRLSTSDAKRRIKQGGVKIDGETIRDPQYKPKSNKGDSLILKVGKLWYKKIIFEE